MMHCIVLLMLAMISSAEFSIKKRVEEYSIVELEDPKILLLLVQDSVIGAKFTEQEYVDLPAFPGFAIMQTVIYVDHLKPVMNTKALQIGLGVGIVPTFFRKQNLETDVVEISAIVAELARDYFHYDYCTTDDCTNGKTYIVDGLHFVYEMGRNDYQMAVVDVYAGGNTMNFYTVEFLHALKSNHLVDEKGVVVLNFVGFITGEHAALSQRIWNTCKAVFQFVQCYREVENKSATNAMNLVYFLSDTKMQFQIPAIRSEDIVPGTLEYILNHFQHWTVFDQQHEEIEVSSTAETIQTKTSPLSTSSDFSIYESTFKAVSTSISNHWQGTLPPKLLLALDK